MRESSKLAGWQVGRLAGRQDTRVSRADWGQEERCLFAFIFTKL